MKERPEYMIIIAVVAALVVSAIVGSVSCSAITSAAGGTTPSPIDALPDTSDGDEGNQGNEGTDADGDAGTDDVLGGSDSYTDQDVPATMEIDVPELQDDLQACINNDLMLKMGVFSSIEITELTKDTVEAPHLNAGRVLGKVSGKATIKTSEGETETVDYSSYYYAADPTVEKVTWYIYADDLGSYSLFPDGFQRVAGDPMNIRSKVDNGIPASDTDLGRDRGSDAQAI